MLSLRVCAGSLLLAAGCSLIYDPDGLRNRDAAPIEPDAAVIDAMIDAEPDAELDAMPPDAMPLDADITMITLDTISPAMVDEGTGGDGGRPVMFYIEGGSISPAVVVTAAYEPAVGGSQPTYVSHAVSHDGELAAVALTIPVITGFAENATRTVRLTFTQDINVATIDFTLRGLDELTITGGTTAVGSLDALYSRITLSGTVAFSGTAPAMLRATGDININGVTHVDASSTTPGVHGCLGGTRTEAGGCGNGKGGNGLDSAVLGAGGGGGGGGFGGAGETGGGGTDGGAPGMMTGNDMLVPIVTVGTAEGNRGNGGGGGGDGTLGVAGGLGGGGAGVIQLSSFADIVVGASGAVRARGGNGTTAAGGGGGGGGGAILMRAAGAITFPTNNFISAAGGDGAGDTNIGGDGGVGRIRVDAAAGIVANMASTPLAVRGPSWDPTTLTLVDGGARLRIFTVLGQPGRSYGLRVQDIEHSNVGVGIGGSGTVMVDLVDGHNSLCLVYTTNALATVFTAEAINCIDVVYVP